MASRRRLKVEEAATDQDTTAKVSFEESCIYTTTVALVVGIIMVMILMGRDFDAGMFG